MILYNNNEDNNKKVRHGVMVQCVGFESNPKGAGSNPVIVRINYISGSEVSVTR